MTDKIRQNVTKKYDILEKGEINTYREKEHELLIDIRFGKFRKADGTFDDSFYDMLSDFEKNCIMQPKTPTYQ